MCVVQPDINSLSIEYESKNKATTPSILCKLRVEINLYSFACVHRTVFTYKYSCILLFLSVALFPFDYSTVN